MDRLAMLQQFVAQRPDDPFARYGLAMELKKRGLLAQANAVFVELMSRHPDYVPAYLMAGNNLLADGDRVLITQSAVVLEKLIGQFMFDRAADAPAQ